MLLNFYIKYNSNFKRVKFKYYIISKIFNIMAGFKNNLDTKFDRILMLHPFNILINQLTINN